MYSNYLVNKGYVLEMFINESRNYLRGIGLFFGMLDLSNVIEIWIKRMSYVEEKKICIERYKKGLRLGERRDYFCLRFGCGEGLGGWVGFVGFCYVCCIF